MENDMDSMIAMLYTIRGHICNNYALDHASYMQISTDYWHWNGLDSVILAWIDSFGWQGGKENSHFRAVRRQ